MKDQSNPSKENQTNPANKTQAQPSKPQQKPDWNKGQETTKKGNQNWDDDEDRIPGYESNNPNENPNPAQKTNQNPDQAQTAVGQQRTGITQNPANPTPGSQPRTPGQPQANTPNPSQQKNPNPNPAPGSTNQPKNTSSTPNR